MKNPLTVKGRNSLELFDSLVKVTAPVPVQSATLGNITSRILLSNGWFQINSFLRSILQMSDQLSRDFPKEFADVEKVTESEMIFPIEDIWFVIKVLISQIESVDSSSTFFTRMNPSQRVCLFAVVASISGFVRDSLKTAKSFLADFSEIDGSIILDKLNSVEPPAPAQMNQILRQMMSNVLSMLPTMSTIPLSDTKRILQSELSRIIADIQLVLMNQGTTCSKAVGRILDRTPLLICATTAFVQSLTTEQQNFLQITQSDALDAILSIFEGGSSIQKPESRELAEKAAVKLLCFFKTLEALSSSRFDRSSARPLSKICESISCEFWTELKIAMADLNSLIIFLRNRNQTCFKLEEIKNFTFQFHP